jgi:hypothetical protein
VAVTKESLVRALLWPCAALSAAGLVASLIAHVCALIGYPGPFGRATWLLHVGIFVVWFPAVLVAQRLTKDFKRKDFWKAAVRGCPRWLRVMTVIFFGYALVNFAVFFAMTVGHGHPRVDEVTELRGFSGHWLAFYSAALAILCSGIRTGLRDVTRYCPQGHAVSPLANYCEQCGAPTGHGATSAEE